TSTSGVAPSTAPASDQTSAVRDEPAVEVKSSPVVAKPVVMETVIPIDVAESAINFTSLQPKKVVITSINGVSLQNDPLEQPDLIAGSVVSGSALAAGICVENGIKNANRAEKSQLVVTVEKVVSAKSTVIDVSSKQAVAVDDDKMTKESVIVVENRTVSTDSAGSSVLVPQGAVIQMDNNSDKTVDGKDVELQTTEVKEMTTGSLTTVKLSVASENSEESLENHEDQTAFKQADTPNVVNHLHRDDSRARFHSIDKPRTTSLDMMQQNNSEHIVNQLKEHFVQKELKQGMQQISLTLTPDNFGELKVNLNLQGQKLSVEIVAENRNVRDAINQNSEVLKATLARQNITMESFDVTTGGRDSSNLGQNQNAWRELAKQQQQQRLWRTPDGFYNERSSLPSIQTSYQIKSAHEMLDIHY
ncbi:MAG: flagellar hook-length control protein FliK, partial [Desulfuromonadaceae bacterium]|nr:flagellar hook-length control protein FliK [Desulfuromonadaceae bacterium]